MGHPDECNCHCGFEAAKKYTCYNGFCVEDELGEYNEPTCSTNCPVPTQYSCISGYCIPTAGGDYNNPTCNNNCPVMPTRRYSCVGEVCTLTRGGLYYEPTCSGACPPRSIDYSCSFFNCIPVQGGPFKNDPTCAGFCDPVIEFRYDCNENGECVEANNGRYINDPTCGGNCGDKRYKCQDGQCVQAADGTYINDPTCDNQCGPSSSYYLLVNCQDENETIVATAPSGAYNPPFNGVWKIDNECWRMVGEIECPCVPPPITLPDTRTPGCDSCNNGVCCFEVWPCFWQNGEYPTSGFSCNTNTGKCEPSEAGTYSPLCNGECGTFYYKICVSGLNPTDCQSYVNQTIKITPCDDPLVPNDYGPPCSPIGGTLFGCQCCFYVVNSIPEDPEATYHNFVNVYNNCCGCNPCADEPNPPCAPGEVYVNQCPNCYCACLEPPCGEPPTTGACCGQPPVDTCNVPGQCTQTTQAECAAQGGTFYPGVPCSPSPCDSNDCPEKWYCIDPDEPCVFGPCGFQQGGCFDTKEQCEQICNEITE